MVTAGDDLGWHGSWRFTREYVVQPELTLLFHPLYEAAFGPLRTRAIARQVLNEEEFGRQMADGDVLKYVAWTADGAPVGMAALTNELSTVPWVSPEYFAAQYPEHWARRAVWYFSFLLAHPSQRHHRFLDELVGVGVGSLMAERAVLAYDMCGYNDETLALGHHASEIARRSTGVTPRRTDVQTYYTVDFTELPSTPGRPHPSGGAETARAGTL